MDFIELVESSMPEIFNTQNLAIEKLEAQVEALSQQLEKETLAEATAEEITSEETITNETAVLPDTIVTTTVTSPPTSNDGTYLQTGLLKFVNYTDIPAEFLQEKANLASSKMASRNSDVIAIIYPLGRFISGEAPSYGGAFSGAEFLVTVHYHAPACGLPAVCRRMLNTPL